MERNIIVWAWNTIAWKPNVISRERNVIAWKPNVIAWKRNAIAWERNFISRQRNIIARERNIILRERNNISWERNAYYVGMKCISWEANHYMYHYVPSRAPYWFYIDFFMFLYGGRGTKLLWGKFWALKESINFRKKTALISILYRFFFHDFRWGQGQITYMG